MADVFNPQKRSEVMSRIRGKDTKPEIVVRKYLFGKGFRYRKNVSTLFGKPDIVLPKYKTVIFIHGCFWHMHKSCKYFKMPSTHIEWWRIKLTKTVEIDKRNILQLEKMGWRVIVVWECELNTKIKCNKRLPLLVQELKRTNDPIDKNK